MILPFLLNICMYTPGKIFNTDLILRSSLFAPVPGSIFAHKAHIRQYSHHSILNKVKILSGIFPCIPIFFFKGMLKFFKTPLFRQTPFQISQIRHRTTKFLHFIEHFQEDFHNGILVLLAICITLGVNIKQDRIRRRFRCQFHICQHHWINNFVILNKIVQGMLLTNPSVFQKIRQDL